MGSTYNNNSIISWNCNSLETAKKPDANFEDIPKESTSPKRNCCEICAIGSLLIFGFMFLTWGIITVKFPLFDIVLRERLSMSRIYPSFVWWKIPHVEVYLNAYIFNITNSAEFISGADKKLKLQEIGPITFQEVMEHKDIEFHSENSTMSYTIERKLIFKESANIKGILNQTIIVPNMASLGGCTYVADSFFLRNSFNAMLMLYKSQPVVSTTIYNYLYNLTDPVLEFVQSVVPFLVPTKDGNIGILENIYKNFSDRVNVQIGVRHGHENFFKINSWNYRPTVPRFHPEKGDCNASIQGSSEGALYPQMCTKETVLWFYRKSLCRAAPLHFDSEVQWGNLKAYKYVLRDDVYDRFENRTSDCYKGADLPDGLSDVSKCFFDQPIVASFPHFYARSGNFTNKLEGLQPDANKHTSYTIIEPILGVPLNQRAVTQSNIVTGNLRAFKSDIAKFSNMVIPMFWMELNLKEIPSYIINTVDFIVNTLPKIQYWLSGAYIVIGLCLLTIGYLRLRSKEVARDKKSVKD